MFDKIGGRKFIAMVYGSIVFQVAFYLGKITSTEFLTAFGGVLTAYTIVNVIESKITNENMEVK